MRKRLSEERRVQAFLPDHGGVVFRGRRPVVLERAWISAGRVVKRDTHSWGVKRDTGYLAKVGGLPLRQGSVACRCGRAGKRPRFQTVGLVPGDDHSRLLEQACPWLNVQRPSRAAHHPALASVERISRFGAIFLRFFRCHYQTNANFNQIDPPAFESAGRLSLFCGPLGGSQPGTQCQTPSSQFPESGLRPRFDQPKLGFRQVHVAADFFGRGPTGVERHPKYCKCHITNRASCLGVWEPGIRSEFADSARARGLSTALMSTFWNAAAGQGRGGARDLRRRIRPRGSDWARGWPRPEEPKERRSRQSPIEPDPEP